MIQVTRNNETLTDKIETSMESTAVEASDVQGTVLGHIEHLKAISK